MLRKLMRKEKGFTLVELMVVILIIAILVAIAIPVYNTARASAKTRACSANLRTLDGAIQIYHSDTDAWPSNVSDLTPDYVRDVPVCPWNSGGTGYNLTGSGSSMQSLCTDPSCPNSQ